MHNRAAFAHALLDADAPLPQGLRVRVGASAEARFAIYRNNVVSGLIDALAESFPATLRIVGEAFFRAMAQVFVRSAPPRSPVLRTFAQGFPVFLDAFPPAQEIACLADVARIEAARIDAWHAADASACTRTMSDDVIAARVTLHPSARLVLSPHPIVTIWRANAGASDVAPIEDWTAEQALVFRDANDAIQVESVSGAVAMFLQHLQDGATLGEAAQRAMAQAGEFDLTNALLLLIHSQADFHADTGAHAS
ncbi:MAG: hypothetical protein JWN07_201 [Hyphomicrobiales bacterium]|nr:hypothetical protein [Hyphomicrobiales bacterium]